MAKQTFFDEVYDEPTITKLKVFEYYIRQWLPVFLCNSQSSNIRHSRINIYDFCSGPGTDRDGTHGSPLRILEELKGFCSSRSKNPAVAVSVNFNDKEKTYIETLQDIVPSVACGKSCCDINYTTKTFVEAFNDALPDINKDDAANLIIIDQFGVKEITEDVFQKLVSCKKTDILFFITSSAIRRFIERPEFRARFSGLSMEVKNIEYRSIHRYICQYYEDLIPKNETYYVSPFSIKKGSNIYGVIFGSHSLVGLRKFLEACWSIDSSTGEANYDIDNDGDLRNGQPSLFEEDNKMKKVDLFYHELEVELSKIATVEGHEVSVSATNHSLYEFILKKGFLPKHASVHLKELQNEGRLEVSGASKRGAFYLGNKDKEVFFTLKELK